MKAMKGLFGSGDNLERTCAQQTHMHTSLVSLVHTVLVLSGNLKLLMRMDRCSISQQGLRNWNSSCLNHSFKAFMGEIANSVNCSVLLLKENRIWANVFSREKDGQHLQQLVFCSF